MHVGIRSSWKDDNISSTEIVIFDKHHLRRKKKKFRCKLVPLILTTSTTRFYQADTNGLEMTPFLHVLCREMDGQQLLLVWGFGVMGHSPLKAWVELGPLHFPCCCHCCGERAVNNTDNQERPVVNEDTHATLCGLFAICLTSCAFLDVTQEHGSPSLLTSNCPHQEVISQLPLQKEWHQMLSSGLSLHRVFSGKKRERSSAFLCLGDKHLVPG